MVKKIVLITTGQPSCNPRIVKEADIMKAAGFDVTVLYCFYINWAADSDAILLNKVKWQHLLVGGCPTKNRGLYLFTRLRYKLAGIFCACFGQTYLMAERAQARAYDELLKTARSIKADWYIGHNLGALAVAANAAKHHDAKAGFDFEDYCRGENIPGNKKILNRISYLENKYLPMLSYYSTASVMIKDAVKKDHPYFKGNIINLDNCFPLKQQPIFREKFRTDKTLQLFWFSQTIGINRGLEILIKALVLLNDRQIHLTLAGRCNEDMLNFIKKSSGNLFSNIHFVGIIEPDALPEFSSRFDVGMALELAVPINRDMCLTNKIFTYLLAGNAIILSETSMQLAFNKKFSIGETFPINDINGLSEHLRKYQNWDILNNQRRYNYKLANETLNWGAESRKMIDTIYSII